ncbi:MAG: hypothetical protein DHS80DRAFT_24479 [Piptocephalis tieghemiana]|nr:MAG: hypothetical protein DHS80DRAFT_24479 [Piptocephalis tieghemiana]
MEDQPMQIDSESPTSSGPSQPSGSGLGGGTLKGTVGSKSSKPKKSGMSKELYDLVGGIPPIPITEEKPVFRERLRLGPRGQKWIQQSFKASSHPDSPMLTRWTKEGSSNEPQASRPPSPKKRVEVVEYTDVEYESLAPSWDLPETDYLFSLCKQYDLRWPIIWDRFDWPGGVRRSIEDLKERYYYVARRVLRARDQPMDGMQYDRRRDEERRQQVDRLFHQTLEEKEEEEALIGELKRFQSRRKHLEREQAQIRQVLQPRPLPPAISSVMPHSGSTSGSSSKKRKALKKEQAAVSVETATPTPSSVSTSSSAKAPKKATLSPVLKKDRLPAGVVQRSARIPIARGGQNTQIKVTACLRDLGVGLRPVMATAKVCQAYEQLQSGVLEMLDLKKLRDRLMQERRIAETRLLELRRGEKGGPALGGKLPFPQCYNNFIMLCLKRLVLKTRTILIPHAKPTFKDD